MRLILLLIAVVLLASCTEQAMFSNDTYNDTRTIEDSPKNITVNTTKEIVIPIIENATENTSVKVTSVEVSDSVTGHAGGPVAVPGPFSPYPYQGNPLDLFKSNTVVIFGNSGSLVAATINLQSYIGAADYFQDDGLMLPNKNVIILGNCTNSFIPRLVSCDNLKDDVVYLKLSKREFYVLIIMAKNPADIFDAVNIMIKPGFTMREEI